MDWEAKVWALIKGALIWWLFSAAIKRRNNRERQRKRADSDAEASLETGSSAHSDASLRQHDSQRIDDRRKDAEA